MAEVNKGTMMPSSDGTRAFHEDLRRSHEVKGASDRGFGLTVGAVLALIGGMRGIWGGLAWLELSLLVVGTLLIILALLAPGALRHLNRAWMRLGILLSRVMTPIVMGVTFVTTVVPIGLIMKLFGKDPLNLRFEPGAESYWIKRQPPGPAPESMKNQF